MSQQNNIIYVTGPTDKVRYEDFAIRTAGCKEIGERCICDNPENEIGNVIAIEPPEFVNDRQRKCITKCFQCGRLWLSDYK